MKVKPFYDFMGRREAIRLAKEAGGSPPYTRDAILQKFKFTNVKRDHDRTTVLLREELYEPNITHNTPLSTILYNAALFRYFGTIEWAREVGWQKRLNKVGLLTAARRMESEGRKMFTGAYMVTNAGRKGKKYEVVLENFIFPFWGHAVDICSKYDLEEWRPIIEHMKTLPGFGASGFMCKEVVLDTMLTPHFWVNSKEEGFPDDFDEWCPLGPGARRGMNRLCGRPVNANISEEQLIAEMKELFSQADRYWYYRNQLRLRLHDIQFQLCEFDKYERARLGEGRPRSLYHPRETE